MSSLKLTSLNNFFKKYIKKRKDYVMKISKMISLFSIGLILIGSTAFANQFNDRQWHSVLVCDGGAVVVDNKLVVGRGGAGAEAQIVVRDPNIIRYFNESGAIHSAYGAIEWIGFSFPMMAQAGTLLDFQLNTGGSVRFDGTGLKLNLDGANWYFRSCTRK